MSTPFDSPGTAAMALNALDMSADAGWDPYIPHEPKTEFSKNLLKSVPRKVCAWLQLMNQESSGEYGFLKWNFTPENGTIIYENNNVQDFFQVWWNIEDDSVAATDERIENLETNLSYFVTVEQKIYDELLQLQKEIYDRTSAERFFREQFARDLPPSSPDMVQSEETPD
jgi:hypothetical protein